MAEETQASATVAEEAELRTVIVQWLKAIRNEDRAGIRANHDPDILMFDAPPPFSSRGLDAYMATWDTFFVWQAKPVQFDLHDIVITVHSHWADQLISESIDRMTFVVGLSRNVEQPVECSEAFV